MKKSSKNRLTGYHEKLFTGGTLFDKIARCVCTAGTLPRKELYEAWETARRIRRRFRGGRIVDMACGHGLLAHILLLLDNSSKTALAVDRVIPKNALRLSGILEREFPRLENRVIYRQADVREVDIFPGDLVVCVHGCGSLTDTVMDRALEQKTRVAVLPCCHDAKASDTAGLEGWMDKSLAIDAVRALRLIKAGYKISAMTIPDEITPKNRLLMGEFKPGEENEYEIRT